MASSPSTNLPPLPKLPPVDGGAVSSSVGLPPLPKLSETPKQDFGADVGFSHGTTTPIAPEGTPSTFGLAYQGFKTVAPQTANSLETAKTPVDQFVAGAKIPFGVTKEVVLQPAAKLATGLGKMAIGDNETTVPKTPIQQFFLGSEPVKPLPETLGSIPKAAYDASANLPTVKAVGANSFSGKLARLSFALPASIVAGGIEALNVSPFEEGSAVAHSVTNAASDALARKIVRDTAESVIRKAGVEIADEQAFNRGLDVLADRAVAEPTISGKMARARQDLQDLVDYATKVHAQDQGLPELPKLIQDRPPISSLDLPEDTKSLMAVHNTTENKINFADRTGGLANPSLAIVDVDKQPLEGYGDITLVAPKELVNPSTAVKGKTYAADVYSPRYPNTVVSVPSAGQDEIIKSLKPYESDVLGSSNDLDFSDIRNSLNRSSLLKAKFLSEKGISLPSTQERYEMRYELDDLINKHNLQGEYDDYVGKVLDNAHAQEKFFGGYTPSGNRRYLPATAENASKLMNRESQRGGEGFFYGLGSIRAKLTPELRTLSKIKEMKHRIVSKAEFQSNKEMMEKAFNSIVEKIDSFAKHDGMNTEENVADYFSGREGRKFFEENYNLPIELKNELESFRRALEKMPTEYFETKFRRPVQLHEFSHAIVPSTISGKTRKILENKGIKLLEYKAGDEADRLSKIQSLRGSQAFGVFAGLEPKRDKDGRVVGFQFNPAKAFIGFAAFSIGKEFLEGGYISARDALESLHFVNDEMERGYQSFKKLASRDRDYLNLDREGLIDRLAKRGATRAEIAKRFFDATAGGGEYGHSDDELLDVFKKRFEKEQEMRAAILAEKQKAVFSKKGEMAIKSNSNPENASDLQSLPAKQQSQAQTVSTEYRAMQPEEKTEQPEVGKPGHSVPPPSMAQKGEAERSLSLGEEMEKARNSAKNGVTSSVPVDPVSGKRMDIPSVESVTQNGQDVKTKVHLLDYLKTPVNVLKKIGLEKEGLLLKRQYEAYVKELPQEINRITAWMKEVPGKDSSLRIFQFLDGKKGVQLSEKEKSVANEIRAYFDYWADRLGLPDDSRITHYVTHIFDQELMSREFDPELAKIITGRVAGSVYDPFLEKRLGGLGYKEDIWAALDAYVKRAVRKANIDEALGPLQRAASSLDLESYKYVERLVSRVNLRPTEVDNLLDNFLKSIIGYRYGARPTAALTRKVRQMVYRGTLGLNLSSAIRNLTQGVNTYAELGEKYTLTGYKDLALSLARKSKELEDVGVLSNSFIEDRELSAKKKILEKLDSALFYAFEFAEKINRGSAYFGAKAKFIAEGVPEAKAMEMAKDLVEKTQFKFSSVDTPVAMQSDLVKFLTQFQSFNLKQTEFLAGKVKAKEWAGLIRYIVGSLVLAYTVGQIIGMKPSDFVPFYGVLTGKTKIGETPPIRATEEVFKAVTDAPDQYGKPIPLSKKISNVGNSLVPFVPAGVAGQKLIKSILPKPKSKTKSGGQLPKLPKLPKLPRMAKIK